MQVKKVWDGLSEAERLILLAGVVVLGIIHPDIVLTAMVVYLAVRLLG